MGGTFKEGRERERVCVREREVEVCMFDGLCF